MSYMALYRKFRPAVFEDVKGQDHIVTTLKNQIKASRLGHAYLFCGTRGTGKTTIAKILAKAVNCESPVDGNPCGQCKTCQAIQAGSSMNVIEIDAASNNGVDNVREIIEEVAYSPAEGKYKVYIIDEVHMLSIGAFNALLKTLEEPPSYVIFILATTEAHKLPVTILSRCQRYDFKRISIDTIAGRMRELMEAEGNDVEEKALRYVAKAADGSMRDGLSLLDQCLAFHYGEKLTYEAVLDVLGAVDTEVFSSLLRKVLDRDVRGCIDCLDEVVMQGRELMQFVNDFTWYLRNLLLAKTTDSLEGIVDLSRENLERLIEEAQMLDMDTILRYIRVFSELANKMHYSSNKRILIEIALVKLCKPEMENTQDGILERIRDLEQKLEKGVVMQAPAGFASDSAATMGQSERTAPTGYKKVTLDKAIPEEIQEVVRKWPSIRNQITPLMRNYIKDAVLSVGENDKLLIVVNDSSHYYALTSNEHQDPNLNREDALGKEISQIIGKEITVEVRYLEPDQPFDSKYPDLSQYIHMDIEIEEE